MAIKLSDHFTFRRLLKFVFPSIVMMVFTSIYGVVDRNCERGCCFGVLCSAEK